MAYVNVYMDLGPQIEIISRDNFHLLGPRLRDLSGFIITEFPVQPQDMLIDPSQLENVVQRYSGRLFAFSGFQMPTREDYKSSERPDPAILREHHRIRHEKPATTEVK